jgi:ubiquinone/menaquinone biosynthesis C-methylase UbiE
MCGDPNKESRNKIILDVGAGEGSSSILLNKEGTFVISLDHNLRMLKKGLEKKTISMGHAVLADARYLPFKSDSLDMVFSRYFMHCVTAHVRYLKEMKRVMKHEAEILIIDFCAPISEVKDFLDRCHFGKAPSMLCCGILTRDELLYNMTRLGIEIRTVKWFKTKKTVSSRKLKSYINEEIVKNPWLKEHVTIRKGKRNFYVYFPVIAVNGTKPHR